MAKKWASPPAMEIDPKKSILVEEIRAARSRRNRSWVSLPGTLPP